MARSTRSFKSSSSFGSSTGPFTPSSTLSSSASRKSICGSDSYRAPTYPPRASTTKTTGNFDFSSVPKDTKYSIKEYQRKSDTFERFSTGRYESRSPSRPDIKKFLNDFDRILKNST